MSKFYMTSDACRQPCREFTRPSTRVGSHVENLHDLRRLLEAISRLKMAILPYFPLFHAPTGWFLPLAESSCRQPGPRPLTRPSRALNCPHESMSRGTNHNAYNRARAQRGQIPEYYQGPAVLELRRARAAARRLRRRLDLCSICREFFRSDSPEVGVFVCPSCQSKIKQAGK